MVKKIGFTVLVIVLLLIINGLLHSIYDLWQKQYLVTSAQNQLREEKLKNLKLKADLSYAQTQQFVDEEARNKLFMTKPGEQQVFISPDLLSNGKQTRVQKQIPNWQQWLKLFY